jgi:hypothetical protein
MRRFVACLVAAVAALTLSGCATGYLLDNQVQTFSHLAAVPVPATYRFERLPSQQTADPAQTHLEVAADTALHRAGFRRDDANPRYSVQVSARIQRVLSPYADPWMSSFGWGFGYAGRGVGVGFGGAMPYMESPWFQREVSVIVRELATSRVVYESRAHNSGPWLDNTVVIPAMFDAALQGFPNPPPGPRRVDMQIGAR